MNANEKLLDVVPFVSKRTVGVMSITAAEVTPLCTLYSAGYGNVEHVVSIDQVRRVVSALVCNR